MKTRKRGYFRCPRCNYHSDPEVITTEAKMYWDELSPLFQEVISEFFKIIDKHVYENKLTGTEKSKFLYTVGGTADLREVMDGIKQYINDEMHLKGKPLSYLAAMIRNKVQHRETQLKAERRIRGYDPPED